MTDAQNHIADSYGVPVGGRAPRWGRQLAVEAAWHALATVGCFWLLLKVIPVTGAIGWLVMAVTVLIWVHVCLRRQSKVLRPAVAAGSQTALGGANRLTLARGLLVSCLAGFLLVPDSLLMGQGRILAWLPSVIYLSAALLDGVDGIWARRRGQVTDLGRKLDTEMDALGLLVASALGVSLNRLPVAYLAAGAAYYLFHLGIWRRHANGLPVLDLPFRPFARTVAGLQMGYAGVALMPLFPADFVGLAGYCFLLPLLTGFVWDWWVVSGRSSQSVPHRTLSWCRRLSRWLPLLCRGILLLFAMPVIQSLSWVFPVSWSLVWWVLCVLMVLGTAGRLSGLLSACLLGLSTPGGESSPETMLVFSASLMLLVFGTGGWSCWEPENRVLALPFGART